MYPVEESFQQLRLEVVHGGTVDFRMRRHPSVVRVMVVCIARAAYASLRGDYSMQNRLVCEAVGDGRRDDARE